MLRSGAHALARAAIAARVGVRGMATSDSGGGKSDFNKEEKHEMDRAAFVKMLRQLANNLNRKRSTARLPINLMGSEVHFPFPLQFQPNMLCSESGIGRVLSCGWMFPDL